MEKVTLGQIVNVVGLQGELKLKSLTHFSSLRYQPGKTIFIEIQGEMKPYRVKRHRSQDGLDFVLLENINSRTEAEKLKGLYTFANKQDIQLDDNSFFYGDLVGCKVLSTTHEVIGRVLRVEEHGIQSHLRVEKNNQSTMLIPFLHIFIKNVDLKNKTITVDIWEGMI